VATSEASRSIILKFKIGDEIRLNADDFARLSSHVKEAAAPPDSRPAI
jgi:hypothetical protein